MTKVIQFGCPPGKGYNYKDLASMLVEHKLIILASVLPLLIFKEQKQVHTDTRYLNALRNYE